MPRAACRPVRRLVPAAVLAALLAGLTVLPSCAVGPSQRPPVAVREVGAGPLPPPASPTRASPLPALPPLQAGDGGGIGFRDCTSTVRDELGGLPTDRDVRFECGAVRADSERADLPLNVVRASLGGAPRGGVPLVVVGEPGGEPGTRRAAQLAARAPLELLRHLVLVGVDQRGAGAAEPVDCVPDSARSHILDADPFGRDPGQLSELLTVARRIAQSCAQVLEDTLPDYDTTTAAADLERLREALGVPRLNAIGIGRGSRVLAVYAERFPASVGRVVIDGAPDPTADEVVAAEERAGAAEQAFDAFATACTAAPPCPLGPDPRQALLTLADRLTETPLMGPGGGRVTAGSLFQGVLTGLTEPEGWAALAESLAGAERGDPAGMRAVLAAADAGGTRLDLGLITACNDTPQRVTVDQAGKLVSAWRQRHPLFGALFAQRLLLCASWPVPTQPAVTGPAQGAPPILVLGTAADPATPLVGSQRTASQLANGLLVTWEGAGHGAYPRTPCITEATDAFLLTATLPRNGTLCPP